MFARTKTRYRPLDFPSLSFFSSRRRKSEHTAPHLLRVLVSALRLLAAAPPPGEKEKEKTPRTRKKNDELQKQNGSTHITKRTRIARAFATPRSPRWLTHIPADADATDVAPGVGAATASSSRLLWHASFTSPSLLLLIHVEHGVVILGDGVVHHFGTERRRLPPQKRPVHGFEKRVTLHLLGAPLRAQTLARVALQELGEEILDIAAHVEETIL